MVFNGVNLVIIITTRVSPPIALGPKGKMSMGVCHQGSHALLKMGIHSENGILSDFIIV